MKNPYFSFDGMYFKTPGDELETRMNVEIACQKIRKFVLGGDQSDAEDALTFLLGEYPKLRPEAKDMREVFLMDDFDDNKLRLGKRVYNRIIDRLS